MSDVMMDAYGGEAGRALSTQPLVEGYAPPGYREQSALDNALPFTGLDVWIILAVAAALILIGLAMRQLGKPRPQDPFGLRG